MSDFTSFQFTTASNNQGLFVPNTDVCVLCSEENRQKCYIILRNGTLGKSWEKKYKMLDIMRLCCLPCLITCTYVL